MWPLECRDVWLRNEIHYIMENNKIMLLKNYQSNVKLRKKIQFWKYGISVNFISLCFLILFFFIPVNIDNLKDYAK